MWKWLTGEWTARGWRERESALRLPQPTRRTAGRSVRKPRHRHIDEHDANAMNETAVFPAVAGREEVTIWDGCPVPCRGNRSMCWVGASSSPRSTTTKEITSDCSGPSLRPNTRDVVATTTRKTHVRPRSARLSRCIGASSTGSTRHCFPLLFTVSPPRSHPKLPFRQLPRCVRQPFG